MQSSFILNLNKASFELVGQVGGKAASLGEMLRAGIPVPLGYVITTEAYHRGMSDELKQAILTAFDQLGAQRVAVRSSAIAEDAKAASWAGQLETYLNMTREGLIEAIEKCWNSIKSDHAAEYARKHGIVDDQKAVAVIVQVMVNSNISGVLFTANPITGNRNEMLVEAANGLGELLVQGEITPESITVSKAGNLISHRQSKQRTKLVYKDGANKKVPVSPRHRVVSDDLLRQLVRMAIRIEQHYGTPQDIEWTVEDDKLYIVQSRPITTMIEMRPEDTISWATTVARRHTPLFLSLAISGQEAGRIKKQTGLLTGFLHMRRSGLAFQFDTDELAAARTVVHNAVSNNGLDFFDSYANQCLKAGQKLLHKAASVERQTTAKTNRVTLTKLLGSYFDSAVSHAGNLLVMILVQFGLEDFLKNFVSERIHDAGRAEHIVAALKMAAEPTHEVANLERLLELGRLVQADVPDYKEWITADPHTLAKHTVKEFPSIWQFMERYKAEFGWMGRMYYAGNPISTTDIVIRLQNVLRHDCTERLRKIHADHKRQVAERAKAISELGGKDAQLLADLVARYMYLRTYRLDVFFMAHEHVLGLYAQVAQTLALQRTDDILYLDWREIMRRLETKSNVEELQSTVAERRQGFEMLTIAGDTVWFPPRREQPASEAANSATTLKGVTACAGTYEGRARIVLNDKAMLDMLAGEVLVTTMTTPSLMLAVEKAGAIVTDEGGMLCHAAIVSRELSIPCVIGTENATKILDTGKVVTIEADKGLVTIKNP